MLAPSGIEILQLNTQQKDVDFQFSCQAKFL